MSKQSNRRSDPDSNSPRHYRPKKSRKGYYAAPRWIGVLVRSGEIDTDEAWALTFVIDEIVGWKRKLNREWVRITRDDWAEMLGMSERRACSVRDALLDKGLLRRREASEAPEAAGSQKRSGWQYAVVNPSARDELDEIREATDPDMQVQNGQEKGDEDDAERQTEHQDEEEYEPLPF